MRILDVDDNELQFQNIDLEKGRLEKQTICIASYENTDNELYYWPKTYYFRDGSEYMVTSLDDPHVQIVDKEKSIFKWNQLENEDKKEIQGIDLIDLHSNNLNQYENIFRYILN